MEKNTKRAIAIGAGLLGLGALGYSALPSHDQTPEQEIERAEPREIVMKNFDFGVYRIDFYATPTQIRRESEKEIEINPDKWQKERIADITTKNPQYSQKRVMELVRQEVYLANPTNDVAVFYSNSDNISQSELTKKIKRGTALIQDIYLSEKVSQRLESPEFRSKLEKMLHTTLGEKDYKIMTPEQYNTQTSGPYKMFGYGE